MLRQIGNAESYEGDCYGGRNVFCKSNPYQVWFAIFDELLDFDFYALIGLVYLSLTLNKPNNIV